MKARMKKRQTHVLESWGQEDSALGWRMAAAQRLGTLVYTANGVCGKQAGILPTAEQGDEIITYR